MHNVKLFAKYFAMLLPWIFSVDLLIDWFENQSGSGISGDQFKKAIIRTLSLSIGIGMGVVLSQIRSKRVTPND